MVNVFLNEQNLPSDCDVSKIAIPFFKKAKGKNPAHVIVGNASDKAKLVDIIFS